MEVRVTVGKRGVITIPAKLREASGVEVNDQLIMENTPEGLLLRPTVNIPVEIYTDERIAEFKREEEELAKLLKRTR